MASSVRNLDLNLLVSLRVLLDERNVTRAGQKLGLSQPAMSAQLAQLRRHFDDPLLVPGRRGLVPTLAAERLLAPLTVFIEAADAVLDPPRSFDPATMPATFRLALPDVVQLAIGVPLVQQLRRDAPHVRLALRRLDRASIHEGLADGSLHAAIVTSAALSPAWQSVPVAREHFVCMMRRGHPAAAAELDLDRYCALDHLLVSTEGGGFSGAVDDALAGLGRSRKVQLSVDNFLVVPHVLDATDLVATLPAQLLQPFAGSLLTVPPPLSMGFSLHLAWHQRMDKAPDQEWLRARIAAAARQLGDGAGPLP